MTAPTRDQALRAMDITRRMMNVADGNDPNVNYNALVRLVIVNMMQYADPLRELEHFAKNCRIEMLAV